MTPMPVFNSLDEQEAAALLRPCLDVRRWVDQVVADRPYATLEALFSSAREAAEPLTADEVDTALARHPRIGDAAAGLSAEAELSRSEQSRLDLDAETAVRLADGNRRYEERFDRVFLVRAAGRSTSQILEQLEHRLLNDDETESGIVGEQLREIALLRLAEVVR